MAAGVRNRSAGGAAGEAEGEAGAETAERAESRAESAGRCGGLCDGQRVVGLPGESAGLSLRRSVSQSDGIESEGAFEREVQRPVADHEAGAGSSPSLDVPGVDAAVAGNGGSSLVRSQEGARWTAWEIGRASCR